MSYNQFISDHDIETMREFVGAMIDLTNVPEHKDDTLAGIQLYSRQITSFTTVAVINMINDHLQDTTPATFNLNKMKSFLLSLKETAEENISLTTQHLREYCENNGIDFDKTPYA